MKNVFWILTSLVLFVACGDDRSSSPKISELPSEVADMDELKKFECGDDFIGEKVYVKDLKADYECDGDHWFETINTGKSSSSSKKNGDAGTESGMTSSSAKSCSSAKSSSSVTSSSSSCSETVKFSSSADASSSSDAQSSFGKNLQVPACRSSDEDDNCEYGLLTDDRDGKTYKTVKIGEQEWMAENLKYEAEDSFCYEDKKDRCKSGGVLYTWKSASIACPSGWHLPTMAEFETLIASVDGGSKESNRASKNLLDGETDDYGFSATGSGFRWVDGTYGLFSGSAFFWTSTENDENNSFCLNLDEPNSIGGKAYLFITDKGMGHYVRCLKGKSTKLDAATESAYSGSYGSLTDERDGQTYKTVKIGSQTWMAENLNLETKNSICYGGSSENCEKYGRLYDWSIAMDVDGIWGEYIRSCIDLSIELSDCSPIYPVRGVCPEGWHLPSYAEFETLIEVTGSRTTAGRKLKSTTDWFGNGNGTDAYGFRALPAGYGGSSADSLKNQGFSANFWSSTLKKYFKYAHHLYITFSDDDVGLNTIEMNRKLSVRCIKNDE